MKTKAKSSELRAKSTPKPAASRDAERCQLELALAACRSIRFATSNAVRHGGEYSLNDLLAAERLAKQALDMTPALIDRAAKGLLAKYRKGGAT